MLIKEPWEEMLSTQQRKLLNSACGDLAAQVVWHGQRLTKDDWRHLIAGTILGWRMMPAIDRGEGSPGFIMLGGSSLDLSKTECTDAITMAFHLGDHPEEQGITCKPVTWCPVIKAARGIRDSDDVLAGRWAA